MNQIKSPVKVRKVKNESAVVKKPKNIEKKKKIDYSHVEKTFGMFEDRKEEILQYLKELRNEE
ncbi:MAG: hypothetical protein SFU91_14065 [Chloroherpetonaceae bacterium]|nr:hypothetical protein [Chloroherpetonaceae bacterium]